MIVEVLDDAEALARRGAACIAAAAHASVAVRGLFHLAVSGGTTPRRMLDHLAAEAIPWPRVHLWQVDERIAPDGDPGRNAQMVADSGIGERVGHLHLMPVATENADDYAAQMVSEAPVLDLVHLGLGADGHTASLIPGDPALESQADVALTGEYQGRRRMTLTFRVLDRARARLWVVGGGDKVDAARRLRSGDTTLIAARVTAIGAVLLLDRAAAGKEGR